MEKRSGLSSGSSASFTEPSPAHLSGSGSLSNGGEDAAEATGKNITLTEYILCGGKPCNKTSPLSVPFRLKMSKMAMRVVMLNGAQ
jgi:hypothetical protein